MTVCQKRQVLRKGGIENGRQFGADGDFKSGASLLLSQMNSAVADVLAPHTDDIGATLCGAKQ